MAATPIPGPSPANRGAQAPAPQKPTSRLAAAISGRLPSKKRYVIYGPGGVGKTTLVASAPKPILLDIEGGSGDVDVTRYPFRDGVHRKHVPRNWADVINALRDLVDSPHSFETVAIDTVGRLQELLFAHMVARDTGFVKPNNKRGKPLETIEDYGFGKGYNIAIDDWRILLDLLDQLVARRNMDVILVGHSVVETFKNPTGDDYDRYQLQLRKEATGLIRGWCDLFAFYSHETSVEAEEDARAKASATGRRVLYLKYGAAWDAKSRLAVPDEVEVPVDAPWATLAQAIHDAQYVGADRLRELIRAELERIGDEALSGRVENSITAAGDDVSRLQRGLASLRDRKPRQPAEEAGEEKTTDE